MPNPTLTTYRDYLNMVTQEPQSSAFDLGLHVKELYARNEFTALSSTVVFLLDFSTKTYPVFLGNNIEQVMGHPRDAFLEGGLDFTLYQYKDFEILNKKIFPEDMGIMRTIPTGELSQFRFSKSYRFKNTHGDFRTMLQRNTVICDTKDTSPVAIFGFIWDITAFTEKGKIIHQVEQFDVAKNTWQSVLSREYYPDIDQNQLLSKREIEILKWSVEGYSSKQIADKLFISFNTVNTHRRNMLRKTNCQNAMELLKYAITNKLL